jgi:16S rRNA (guanine(966)-N(2))-methyltransferase RsmD
MRITGGKAGGRKLSAPKHGGVRPTSDKVKEALFSVLGHRVEGVRFLELYAGSGAVGIEALSRGADFTVFVDNSKRSCALIRQNLDTLGFREQSSVYALDALKFISRYGEETGPFGVIFLDPPYHEGLGEKTLNALGECASGDGCGILTDDTVIVYEHFKKHLPPDTVGGLVIKKRYNYGDTVISVYVPAMKEDES